MQSRHHLRPRPRPYPYNRWQGGTQTRYVAALSHLIHQEEQANVVIDLTSGQALKYRHLIRGPNRDTWIRAFANNLGRLYQVVGTRMPTGTNTVLFIAKLAIPHGHKVTYAQMVASIRPTKAEVNRVRVTVGRDRLNFPGATTTHCASLITIKCLLNSTISIPGACFMTLKTKDFYYGTAMARYDYMKLALACIPDRINDQYSLHTLSSDGWDYLDIRKGMPVPSKPAASPTTDSKLTSPISALPQFPESRHYGSTPPSPSFSPLSLTTLESSTSAKRMPTTSSNPSRNSTPYPLTGLVPYSADSPLTGTIPHAPVTYPCQSINKQPC